MYCLKCGRDTIDDHVFCDSCQAAMDHYPVKPGTAIHLPQRPAAGAVKKTVHRKRIISQEEQLANLRKALRRMRVCVAVLTIVLGLATALLLHEVFTSDSPIIGQNYTIDTTMGTD